MPKKTNLFVFIMLLLTSSLSATSFEISGHISADTTWTGVDTVKVVGNIVVDNGRTLTIDPGIYVECQGYYKITVDGTLLAVGTASEMITFTAADHETGWKRIVVDNPSNANDSTKIVYCQIEYGRANQGGALYIYSFNKILVSNCIFSNNYAEGEYAKGGAIFLRNCNARFINNVITNNEAYSYGGGIYFHQNSTAKLINNTICNNTSQAGGGIFCYEITDPIFRNTILFNNSAYSGEQVCLLYNSCDPNFYFCDIEGGLNDFHIAQGTYTGNYEHCLDIDPQFVSSGDHPYDLTETSPCINFGDPTTTTDDVGEEDFSGEPRIENYRIDIGAYETYKSLDGFPKNALEFDGIDDYVDIVPLWETSPAELTCETWVYPYASNDEVIFFHGDNGEFFLAINSGVLEFKVLLEGYGWYLATMPSFPINEWSHIAGIWKKNNYLKLYVNGELKDEVSVPDAFLTDPGSGYLPCFGSYHNVSAYYNGKIDEFAVWNVERTQTEIRENIHLTLEGTETGLINYYQFNEGTDIYCNEPVSGNYGTLTNMDNDDWIDSTVPIGNGISQSLEISGGYDYYFNDVDVYLFFTTHTGMDTVVVSRLELSPNINPADVYETLDSQYFIINKYGDGAYNNVSAQFRQLQENLTSEDNANPEQIQLYKRASNSDSDWSFCQYAYSVAPYPYNRASFSDIGDFSQFIICRNLIPDIEVSPLSFTEELQRGENTTQTLIIENVGTGDLDFEISLNQTRDAGGPDVFGYEWTDSDEPDGPVYDWIDISATGTEIISNGDWTYSEYGDADDAYKELDLPFTFYFYGEEKTTLKISSNGFLTFGNDGVDAGNDPIPDTNEPNDLIAPFWEDLDPSVGGNIYYYNDLSNNRFIVQYQDVPRQGVPSRLYTFQVILSETGEILFQYEDMDDFSDPGAAGIENSTGSDGLEIFYHDYYIHNSLAVRFTTLYWLSLETYSGSVPSGSPLDIDVYFKTRNLLPGEYTDRLQITSNDPDEPEIIIPVTLTISDSLSPPQNLTIEIIGTDVQISWDAVDGANSYKIYTSDDPYAADWGNAADSVAVTSWTYDITGIEKKFYYVTASSESVTRDSNLERKTSEVFKTSEVYNRIRKVREKIKK